MTQTAATPEPPTVSAKADEGRMRWLRLRRRESHARGAAHTRRVRLLRVALPLIALGLFGALLAWPVLHGGMATPKPGSGGLEMIDAKLSGADNKGQPYLVQAARVDRDPTAPAGTETLLLRQPVAKLDLKDGAALNLTARDGRYARADGQLSLSGGMRLTHSDGFVLVTDRAEIDLNRQQASGDRPVQGAGPSAAMAARGFQVLDGGARILLSGGARLRLYDVGKPSGGPRK